MLPPQDQRPGICIQTQTGRERAPYLLAYIHYIPAQIQERRRRYLSTSTSQRKRCGLCICICITLACASSTSSSFFSLELFIVFFPLLPSRELAALFWHSDPKPGRRICPNTRYRLPRLFLTPARSLSGRRNSQTLCFSIAIHPSFRDGLSTLSVCC